MLAGIALSRGMFFFFFSSLTLIKVSGRIRKRRRREFLSVMASVLECAVGGALKTEIMRDARVSYSQLEGYLSVLVGLKLLEVRRRGRFVVYAATGKGIAFLRKLEEIERLLADSESQRPLIE